MIITTTEIEGAYILQAEPIRDNRGFFERIFDVRELNNHGLNSFFVQSNLSQNIKKGTLRGLHSQNGNDAEDKLVMCVGGEIYDVCVDVRKNSSTFGKYVYSVLSEENGKMLYVPKGCAHGYMTLQDNSRVLYFVTQYYNPSPSAEMGYRYDDPLFGIKWPLSPPYIISDKDASWAYVDYTNNGNATKQ